MKPKRTQPMTTKQRIAAIEKVIVHHDKLDYEWNRLIAVVGNHDMPLHEQSWAVFDAYVEAVAREIGDDFGWLKWFIFDNKCGLAGMEATAGFGAPKRPIRAIHGLVELIEAKAP
jgi:hypothetical protein